MKIKIKKLNKVVKWKKMKKIKIKLMRKII